MGDRNAQIGCGGIQDRGLQQGGNQAEYGQPHDGADNVKGKMDDRGTLRVLVGAEGGQQRGHTGADILTHDDGNSRGIGNRTGSGQGLQDTHRRGAGLDDGGQNSTHQNTQNRVLEHQEQILEGRDICQT